MKNLIKFAQTWDIFVIDLVWSIKLTWVKLHELFLDPFIVFKFDVFVFFQSLMESTNEISFIRWITYISNGIDYLAFKCETNHSWA
jgi:hypothetical protein